MKIIKQFSQWIDKDDGLQGVVRPLLIGLACLLLLTLFAAICGVLFPLH